MPPGTREVRHRHARARQFFYVLAGTLTMEVEGTRHRLAAAHGDRDAPGTAHQAINDGDADVEFLVVSTPPSHGDRIAADRRRRADSARFPRSRRTAHIPLRRTHIHPEHA